LQNDGALNFVQLFLGHAV